MKTFFGWGVLSSLLLLPITSLALSTYNADTGYLAIPEVKDGNTFYDNVGLKLNFTNGTFELVAGNERPETGSGENSGGISTTPIDFGGDERIRLDFMGCERSGSGGEIVTCHVNFTSLGGIDRKVGINAGSLGFDSLKARLYDSSGALHYATSGTIANIKTAHIGGSAKVLLIANVPTLATFQFANISPERGFSLFKPSFSLHNEWFTIDFRKFSF